MCFTTRQTGARRQTGDGLSHDPPPEGWRRLTKRKAAAEEPGGRHGVVRLFAFGKEKAREKVRTSVRDWDAQLDWFVA